MDKQVCLSIDEELWPKFRSACVLRKVSASTEVEAFMVKRLKEWETQEAKREAKAKEAK